MGSVIDPAHTSTIKNLIVDIKDITCVVNFVIKCVRLNAHSLNKAALSVHFHWLSTAK